MDKEAITARLNELIARAKNGYEKYKPIFEVMSKQYLLELEQTQKEALFQRNKSAVFFPKMNSKAKRIKDALSETYFNTDRFVDLQEYINSNPKVIEKWQTAVDFYADKNSLYKIFDPEFLRISFIGTSVAKVYWNKTEQGVSIEILNIDDIYFDPEAVNFKDIRYVVNRSFMTISDILELRKNGVYKFDKSELEINENYPYERVEIYDIYELQGGEWVVSTLLNNTILRAEVKLKDGLPFIVGYMSPQFKAIDDENFVAVYGEPNLSSVLPLQTAINNTGNSVIDGINQQLKPKLIADKNAQISRLDIETIGQPIFTSQPTAVQVAPAPNVAGAFNALELFDREMSENTGISPQLNGVSSSRAETATMSSIMANEGSTRLQGYIRTYNETFFEPIFERFAELVWKYGEALFFAGYSRRELGSYRIKFNTGIGSLNKEVQKNSLIEAGVLLEKHLAICLQTGDMDGAVQIKEAHKRLVKELLPIYGIKDIEQIFKEKDEFIRETIGGDNQAGINQPLQTQTAGALGEIPFGVDNSQIAMFG